MCNRSAILSISNFHIVKYDKFPTFQHFGQGGSTFGTSGGSGFGGHQQPLLHAQAPVNAGMRVSTFGTGSSTNSTFGQSQVALRIVRFAVNEVEHSYVFVCRPRQRTVAVSTSSTIRA